LRAYSTCGAPPRTPSGATWAGRCGEACGLIAAAARPGLLLGCCTGLTVFPGGGRAVCRRAIDKYAKCEGGYSGALNADTVRAVACSLSQRPPCPHTPPRLATT
jgi:hypothetical protein